MTQIKRMMLSSVVLVVIVLLAATNGLPLAFANFCQISNVTYNYPQQVTPGQAISTSITVSGVCAPDDANYYSIRGDLDDMSGFVLSATSVPIGFSQGQTWQVTVPNSATAPSSVGSWQIQFTVYVFAAIGSGERLDSVTVNQVTIQVGTAQSTQTVTSMATNVAVPNQTASTTSTMMQNTTIMTTTGTQSAESSQAYDGLVAIIAIVLIVGLILLAKKRTGERKKKENGDSK